jgi:hypothetical protein
MIEQYKRLECTVEQAPFEKAARLSKPQSNHLGDTGRSFNIQCINGIEKSADTDPNEYNRSDTPSYHSWKRIIYGISQALTLYRSKNEVIQDCHSGAKKHDCGCSNQKAPRC